MANDKTCCLTSSVTWYFNWIHFVSFRALGETAPLVLIGIPTILLATPRSILDQFSALPIQIFTWAKMPQEEFQNVASAGIIVLLVILILMNGVAIILRNKFSKKILI